tara:strand:- start:1630 stop:2544 length:915 start_codon:yes stop_codon:yes gene_type:complete
MIPLMAPKFHAARAVLRERKLKYEGIQRNTVPRVPSHSTPELFEQFELWKGLIAYERENAQRLVPMEFAKRVMHTYTQCLLSMYFFPEVWYDAAIFRTDYAGGEEGAQKMFERGIRATPDSLLLRLSMVGFLESKGNTDAVEKAFESMIKYFGQKKFRSEVERKHTTSIIFLQYMLFARRSFGIDKARKIFMMARKNPDVTHHVYSASALMEYHVSKDPKIARNIFELGMKKFLDVPAYAQKYISFLMHLNQDNNIRVLYERVLNRTTERAAELAAQDEENGEDAAKKYTNEVRCSLTSDRKHI